MSRLYRSAIVGVTATVFFVWILPLGAYIKPSQEKQACNGQRAICLCSHDTAESGGSGQAVYKGAGTGQKESAGPGGAGHHFLVEIHNPAEKPVFVSNRMSEEIFSSLDFIRPIDHVPRA